METVLYRLSTTAFSFEGSHDGFRPIKWFKKIAKYLRETLYFPHNQMERNNNMFISLKGVYRQTFTK